MGTGDKGGVDAGVNGGDATGVAIAGEGGGVGSGGLLAVAEKIGYLLPWQENVLGEEDQRCRVPEVVWY